MVFGQADGEIKLVWAVSQKLDRNIGWGSVGVCHSD